MIEVETKILDVDPEVIRNRLMELGANFLGESRLSVDWFRTAGSKEGDDAWDMRMRSYNEERYEVTWKEKKGHIGIASARKEINYMTSEPDTLTSLFLHTGLEIYAHQDKIRKSWELGNLRFDLDQYPGIPPYLEIEAPDETSILDIIPKLELNNHRTSNQGERVMISENYGKNWYEMRF